MAATTSLPASTGISGDVMKQRLTSKVPIECHSLVHENVQMIEFWRLAADFTILMCS